MNKQAIQRRLQRLRGASPDAIERMHSVQDKEEWTARCRRCGHEQKRVPSEIVIPCPKCGAGANG